MASLPSPPSSQRTGPDSAPSRTVLVTGGSRGIGRAICLEFARAGWRVGVHYRERKEEAEQTVGMIQRSGGEGAAFQADIRVGAQVRDMVNQAATRWGRLDAMICNAGQGSASLAIRMPSDHWSLLIETNLTGAFHCLQAVGNHMSAQREGVVVLVGSYAAQQGSHGQAAYAAAKAGLFGLAKSAAREWGPSNVRVNVVLPGWHRTELSESAMPTPEEMADHVLGRSPDLQAVARAIRHLTEFPEASGQVWNLDSRIF